MRSLERADVAILAGGAGSRLRPVWRDRPKVLVPVGDRPLLDVLLERLAAAGARRVLLCLGFAHEAVEEHLARSRPPGGLAIETSVEREPLGTGGALRFLIPRLRSPSLLALNGDCLTRADLDPFLAFHDRVGAEATLLLSPVRNRERFGTVETDEAGRVTRFAEKEQAGAIGSTCAPGDANAGVYAFRRSFVDALPERAPLSLERDVFPDAARAGRLFGYRCGDAFLDVGTPESLAAAAAFLRGEPVA